MLENAKTIRPAVAIVALVMAFNAPGAFGGALPGQDAPDFTLPDTEGKQHALADYLKEGKTVVLEWFNPDCPFIVKHHQKHKTMNETFAKVKEHDVVWLAVNSSAEGKQGFGLERNRKAIKDYGIPFPVLMDPEGAVGKAYGAKTTPHMFIITPDGKVAYNGAIDDNRSATELGQTNHVLTALHQLMQGQKVETAETAPYGCSVKYAK
jgi:peroxiredoxin